MHRQYLNHSCLRNRLQADIPNHTGLGRSGRTADPRTTALQIRAPKHLHHPVSFR